METIRGVWGSLRLRIGRAIIQYTELLKFDRGLTEPAMAMRLFVPRVVDTSFANFIG